MQPDKRQALPPKFVGNLDLYAMTLEFLKREYLPSGTTTPQYNAVYKAILKHQAKNDSTAKCYLGPSTGEDVSLFESGEIEDPMEEVPFEIAINSVKRQASLSFTKSELASFAAPETIPGGPGISGKMGLVGGRCGIQSASGIFKMKRVWTKLNSDGEFVELFEGFVSFNVRYNSMYTTSGFENGSKVKFAFWGVRARTDSVGKEIGLCPMTPVSVSSAPDDFINELDAGKNLASNLASHVQVSTICPSRISYVYLFVLFQVNNANPTTQISLPPKFWGNFDVYAMCLDDDLHAAYLPEGSDVPHFEEVHNAIAKTTTEQAAQIYLGAPVQPDDDDDLDAIDSESDEDSMGQMRGPTICDPFVEQPYNIVISNLEEEDSLAFTDDELGQFPSRDSDPPGPGMTGQLTLASSSHRNVVTHAAGHIKLIRVWAKQDPLTGKLLELFEGYFSLDVIFDWRMKKYKKKDGLKEYHGFSFWAVRGNETGPLSPHSEPSCYGC